MFPIATCLWKRSGEHGTNRHAESHFGASWRSKHQTDKRTPPKNPQHVPCSCRAKFPELLSSNCQCPESRRSSDVGIGFFWPCYGRATEDASVASRKRLHEVAMRRLIAIGSCWLGRGFDCSCADTRREAPVRFLLWIGIGVQAAAADGERLAHRPASRGAKKGFGSLHRCCMPPHHQHTAGTDLEYGWLCACLHMPHADVEWVS